ncbi:MAG: riboflavin biosynthesis protein RibF [Acidobacteria bacterium RBG_16_68_9]|nr:MAG: riboflavin biosynthesis protein RibF [Acidobacteria bacterium RBG_16_68_9]
MRVVRRVNPADFSGQPSVVTLGNFDGVHRGHQAIFQRVVERARRSGGPAVAVTFFPHPAAVLGAPPPLLTNLHQRLGLLAAAGIDVVVLIHFTRQFARIEAAPFVVRFLVDGLRVAQLVVGHRVGFGHRRAGNAALLSTLSRAYGFELEVVDAVDVDGLAVSSSAIRETVRRGDVQAASRMLGRPYGISERVRHGQRRGVGLGFPTANVSVRGLQLPPDGVYAVRVLAGGREHRGVANLGFNPTFGNEDRALEAHLFDFQGNLYRQRIEIRFVARLRGERKFENADALANQIRQDVATARRVLS